MQTDFVITVIEDQTLENKCVAYPTQISPISYFPCTDQSLNMCLEPITEDKIIKITNEFQKGKAVGHDNVLMSMIQQTIQLQTIPKPLESFRTITRYLVLYL